MEAGLTSQQRLAAVAAPPGPMKWKILMVSVLVPIIFVVAIVVRIATVLCCAVLRATPD
jgi:hypothetical protein